MTQHEREPSEWIDDPRMVAGVQLLERTGAASFSIRYAEDDTGSKEPVAWVALVRYEFEDGTYWECEGGMNPVRAILRLCERMCDGGTCAHCDRPTGLDPDSLDDMPADQFICWYQFDPELQTFRRGCEGDT